MSRPLPTNWGTVKREALKRDNYSCMLCGVSRGMRGIELHVHHIVPRKRGGSHDIRNLVTVCSGCHIKIHHSGHTAPRNHMSTIDSLLESIESYRWQSANLTNVGFADGIARQIGSLVPTPRSVGNHLDIRSSVPDVVPRKFADFILDVRAHDQSGGFL